MPSQRDPRRGPLVDHVCWLVREPQDAEALLAEAGLGFERGMFYERAGTQHYNVWLQPPQHLEFLYIADRARATVGDVGAGRARSGRGQPREPA